MRVRGGKHFYGIPIGVLILDTRFPRIPGEIGHAETFDFPVLYHRVASASPDRVVRKGDTELLGLFLEGARYLEGEGVRAITTSCGFLAKFQQEMAAAVRVPVFTSSLMQVPLVARMLGPGRSVGILTIDAPSLTRDHFEGVGITSDIPVVVVGMEGEKEFNRVILGDELELDVEVCRGEHVRVARRMISDHPEVGAIVLECTNMPPYRADIQAATGLPVFDIVTLTRMVYETLPRDFPELRRP